MRAQKRRLKLELDGEVGFARIGVDIVKQEAAGLAGKRELRPGPEREVQPRLEAEIEARIVIGRQSRLLDAVDEIPVDGGAEPGLDGGAVRKGERVADLEAGREQARFEYAIADQAVVLLHPFFRPGDGNARREAPGAGIEIAVEGAGCLHPLGIEAEDDLLGIDEGADDAAGEDDVVGEQEADIGPKAPALEVDAGEGPVKVRILVGADHTDGQPVGEVRSVLP